MRVQFPSRNYLIQALFWGSIIFFCLYLTHIAQLKLSTYSTPSVYIIDDFTDEAGSEAHGLQVYNLINKNLPEGFADIYCVNISLGKSSSVDELNRRQPQPGGGAAHRAGLRQRHLPGRRRLHCPDGDGAGLHFRPAHQHPLGGL